VYGNAEYYYGPLDEKVAEDDNGSMRYFFGGGLERLGSDALLNVYVAGRIVATLDTSGRKYYLTDHLGSVRVVLDDTAGATERVDYLPFGDVRQKTAGGTLPDYRFNGNRQNMFDVYDYNARSYLPSMAAFLEPDVMGGGYEPQGMNRLAYCVNDPVGRIDPSGYRSFIRGAYGQAPFYGYMPWHGDASGRGSVYQNASGSTPETDFGGLGASPYGTVSYTSITTTFDTLRKLRYDNSTGCYVTGAVRTIA